jgi:LysM repeat protein
VRAEWRVWGPRIAAPAAFLLAATAGVLAARSAGDGDPATPPAATTTRVPIAPQPPSLPTPERFHIVRSGDTLATIAEANGTTVERLLELNPGIDPVALPVGARIRVP